jgi:acyl-CoA synthetase (AMP-forming)/AMP-acid ligase II
MSAHGGKTRPTSHPLNAYADSTALQCGAGDLFGGQLSDLGGLLPRPCLTYPARMVALTAAAVRSAGVPVRHRLLRLVSPGARVAVVGHGGDDLLVIVAAALAAGVVVVPVNPGYREGELRHVLRDAGCALVIDARGAVAAGDVVLGDVAAALDIPIVAAATLAAPPAEAGDDDVGGDDPRSDDDPAMLIYTSGTTGRSKGCTHTRRTLREGLGPLMTLWGIGADDVVINSLPLFHVHGLCVAGLGPLQVGARVALLERFSPEAVRDAILAGGTVLMCVPTMIHRLIGWLDAHPDDAAIFARLRLVTCGSAPLSADQLEAFRARTGLTVLERYGMSETLITLSNPLVGERVPGAVGRPVPGTRIRVVDDELQVQTPGLMRGYWGRRDADAEVFVDDPSPAGHGRWFRTGDAVTVDDDGVVRIVGRLSQDILKVGGFKLSTREIEDEIARHPAVAEVCVVGLPDEEWGERVCAAVVLRPGHALTLPALQAAVDLTAAKKPRALVVFDALPRNAMGKVLKSEVKARALAMTAVGGAG